MRNVEGKYWIWKLTVSLYRDFIRFFARLLSPFFRVNLKGYRDLSCNTDVLAEGECTKRFATPTTDPLLVA
jgi:hypothetical protein